MISQPESGLSPTDYDALKAAVEDNAFTLLAYPLYPTYILNRVQSDAGKNFNVCLHDDKLYALAGSLCERFDGTGWVPVSGFTVSGTSGHPYPMISDGDDLVVYAFSSTKFMSNTLTSDTWSGWVEEFTASAIHCGSATAVGAFHYVTKDSSKNVYRFHSRNGMTTIDSDIYWQYPITSFDAIRWGDKDILVFTSETPGYLTQKVENGVAQSYLKPSQAICCIHYENGVWSDVYFIEYLDDVSAYRYRSKVRLQILNDRLCVTAFGATGSSLQAYTFYRAYYSKDGKFWSQGQYTLSGTVYDGLKIIPYGGYVYAVESGIMYRGLGSYMIGVPTALDLTENVMRLSLSQGEMSALRVILDNAETDYEQTFLPDTQTALVLSLGRHIDDAPVTVQKGIFEIDTISFPDDDLDPESGPPANCEITARDFIARMSGKTQSEEFIMYDPNGAGQDRYINRTDSEYGGLMHTASIQGAWTTAINQLLLRSSNKEGLAYNTLLQQMWNGEAQVSFLLPHENTDEYAGVVFRGADKDNYWSAKYDRTIDYIDLSQMKAGQKTTLASSSTLGWQGTQAWRWIKVTFHYAHIIVYVSTDGVSWTSVIDYIAQGAPTPMYSPDLQLLTNPLLTKGSVGVIGLAYSSDDTWGTGDQPVFPEPGLPTDTDWLDPNTGLPPAGGPKYLFALGTDTKAAVSTSFDWSTGDVTWRDISDGLTGTIIHGCVDPLNVLGRYAITTTGLYYKADLYADDAWTLVANNLTMFGNATYFGHKVLAASELVFVLSGQHGCAISTDRGSSWTTGSLAYTEGGAFPDLATAVASSNFLTALSSRNRSDAAVAYVQGSGYILYSTWMVDADDSTLSMSLNNGLSWIDSSILYGIGTGGIGDLNMAMPYKINLSSFNTPTSSPYEQRAVHTVFGGTAGGGLSWRFHWEIDDALPASFYNGDGTGARAEYCVHCIDVWPKDGRHVIWGTYIRENPSYLGLCISTDGGLTIDTTRTLLSGNFYASFSMSPLDHDIILTWAHATDQQTPYAGDGMIYFTNDAFVTKWDVCPSFFTNKRTAYVDMGY